MAVREWQSPSPVERSLAICSSSTRSARTARRDLLAGIALLLTSCQQKRPAQDSLFKARSTNHVNIRVADVTRSEAFSRKVLGFPPLRHVTPGTAFALDFPAGGFLSLCPLSANGCGYKSDPQPGDIDDFDIGIENCDARRVRSKLKGNWPVRVNAADDTVDYLYISGILELWRERRD